MNLKSLMVLNAVIAAVFGIAFVLIPSSVYSLYGPGIPNPILLYMGQLFGAALIGYAILTWLGRNVSEPNTRRAIVLALFISEGIGCIVALIGQINGVVNALGWSTVAIYFILALGFGYFYFVKPSS